MKTLIVTGCAIMAIYCFTATAGEAADAKNGRKLARKCSVCHGKIGLGGGDPEVPNLAGQPALYLEKSLKDYRSGARKDRRMTLLAKNLSDTEIKDIAAWFSSIVITAAAPAE